ncbi:hypothetical protein HC761_01130 [bacterium]|nr:hypothetical protein [bacterium]
MPIVQDEQLIVAYNQPSYLEPSKRVLSKISLQAQPSNVRLELLELPSTVNNRSFYESEIALSVEGDRAYQVKLEINAGAPLQILSCGPTSAGSCGTSAQALIHVNAGQTLRLRLRFASPWTFLYANTAGPIERNPLDNTVFLSPEGVVFQDGYE